MEHLYQQVQKKFELDPSISGVLAVRGQSASNPVVDGFDLLLLVVTKQVPKLNYIHHYRVDEYLIQERYISQEAVNQWIITGENRNIIEWLLKGEICLDRDFFLEATRERLLQFPREMKVQKLFIEFNYFLRRYLQSKQYMSEGHVLDAYANIMEALLHWARISIIDQGAHPEVTVWQQVKKINPGIYKLYEELIHSVETIEQRVELVLLACEFNVMTKMAGWCELLIDVLKSRREPFSPEELKYNEELAVLKLDIMLALKTLVKRGIIREVVMIDDTQADSLPYVRYTV